MNKFKAGDWITIKSLQDHKFQLTEKEVEYSEILLGYCRFGVEDWELWQPKPGEWCWVFNHLTEIPILRKVIRVEDNYSNRFDDDKFTKAVRVGRGDALDEEVGYRFCEPYIGTLPSTIEQY